MTWITDAMRFVDAFGEPISQSMPHIYLSALAFAPWASMIPQHYASLYPSIGILKANQPSSWLDVQPILRGHTFPVYSVAFSPDGAQFASGSFDKTIRLWDAKTGAAIGKPLQGHTSLVLSVAFSPDGAQIASGSADETIWLWDAKTGAAIGEPLQGHTGWVRSVAFSPDGAQIASGSKDKTVRLWDAKLQSASLCKVTLPGSSLSHSRQMEHRSLRAQLTRQFGCGMRRPVLQSASLCEVTLASSSPSHSHQMVHGSLRAQLTTQFGCGM